MQNTRKVFPLSRYSSLRTVHYTLLENFICTIALTFAMQLIMWSDAAADDFQVSDIGKQCDEFLGTVWFVEILNYFVFICLFSFILSITCQCETCFYFRKFKTYILTKIYSVCCKLLLDKNIIYVWFSLLHIRRIVFILRIIKKN